MGDVNMADPLVAIVGSVDTQRNDYDPALRNVDAAKQACEELGRELAKSGYRIVVYTADPAYIEADIVRGYVASNLAKPKSIEVRYPQSISQNNPPSFPEQITHPNVFDERPDAYPNWQVSFYASLKDAGGVLLLGGASSALITGVMAQLYHIPLISIATFGGSAQNVWALSLGNLVTEEERRIMGSPTWRTDSAEKLIKSLGDQRRRLLAEEVRIRQAQQLEQKALRNRALAAGVLLLGAVMLSILGTFQAVPSPTLFGLFFFGTPLLAGASGGVARNLFDYFRGLPNQSPHATSVAAVLGMMAGLIAAVLFVIAQWASNPAVKDLAQALPPGLNLLVPFELVIGFIAGLTLETVFTKLQGIDVVNVSPVTVKEL
jgi:hypothetical protein